MKKLSDEQIELLELVPQDFIGSQGEKLVYGAFISRNYEAIANGNKTFPLSFTLLQQKTGLKRARLSKIVNTFIANNLIGEVGEKEKKGKCRTYYTFYVPEKKWFKSGHQKVDTIIPSISGTYEKVDTKSRHQEIEKVDTTYTYTPTNTDTITINNSYLKALLDKIDQLEGRLDKASEVVRTLKKRIRVLEENNTSTTDMESTANSSSCEYQSVNIKQDKSQIEMNKTFTELVEVMKDETSTREKKISTAAQIQYLVYNGSLNDKQVRLANWLIHDYKQYISKADQNQVKSSTVNKPTPKVAHTPLPTIFSNEVIGDCKRFADLYKKEATLTFDEAADLYEAAQNIIGFIKANKIPQNFINSFNQLWYDDEKTGFGSPLAKKVHEVLRHPNKFKEKYDKALEAEIPNENLAVSE